MCFGILKQIYLATDKTYCEYIVPPQFFGVPTLTQTVAIIT